MAIKPMLFNAEMVQAILDGRKTVTRRAVKFPRGWNPKFTGYIPDGAVLYGSNNIPAAKAPYKAGNVLWVRETWLGWYAPHGEVVYFYKATDQSANKAPTGPEYDDAWEVQNWRPSIHMPKEAARIFLRVTDVRVERLQEITAEGALDEGTNVEFPEPKPSYISLAYTEMRLKPAARQSFARLWDSTIKPADRAIYGWEANPWVWVIEFERCEKPEGWPC